jgi:hypothetical protein
MASCAGAPIPISGGVYNSSISQPTLSQHTTQFLQLLPNMSTLVMPNAPTLLNPEHVLCMTEWIQLQPWGPCSIITGCRRHRAEASGWC